MKGIAGTTWTTRGRCPACGCRSLRTRVAVDENLTVTWRFRCGLCGLRKRMTRRLVITDVTIEGMKPGDAPTAIVTIVPTDG